MAENLPAWVKVGAEAILTFGSHTTTAEKLTVVRITPTGQVVFTGQSRGERRFRAIDFRADGTAHRWLSSGRMMGHALDVYPMDHAEVPKIIAREEHRRAWSRVQSAMHRLEQSKSQDDGYMLSTALNAWHNATRNLEGA